jgi:hypothetical protein
MASINAAMAFLKAMIPLTPSLKQFRNYCGLVKIATCGFP